jgi:hypothetical protein
MLRGIIPLKKKGPRMGVFRKPPIDPIIVADSLISNLRDLPEDGRRIRTPRSAKGASASWPTRKTISFIPVVMGQDGCST